MYLLSLEGAKSFNFCVVASMHRLRTFSDPDALIIIVLIFVKDGRASTMDYKQTSITTALFEEQRKDRTSK
jgi:hypothetical protein